MEIGTYNTAKGMRERIKELKIIKGELERKETITIGGATVPKGMRGIMLQYCEEEIERLESGFEKL